MTTNELIPGWAFRLMIIASLAAMLWVPAMERYLLEEIKDSPPDKGRDRFD